MRLYFARHGESEANVQGVFWNQPTGYGLTDKGRAQARALSDHLAGVPFAALYCSPVLRAAQTAEIAGQRLGLVPEIADGLREWYTGVLEGQKCDEETEPLYWEVVQQWMVHDNHEARIEGGESYNDVAARFIALIDGVQALYQDTGENVLLISHGGTLRGMLPLLLSNVDKASVLHRPFTYATPIVAELRQGAWVGLRWGDEVLPEASQG